MIIIIDDPVIRGQITLPTKGKLFHGRAWYDKKSLEKELSKHDISMIVNLREDQDDIESFHFPFPDFGVPDDLEDFKQKLSIIINALESGKNIFVHCWAGIGRTGTLIAIILKNFGKTSEEALQIVKDQIGGPETLSQISFVKDY